MNAKVFLFPGQGSQAVGMGAHLWESYPTARRTLEEADRALGEPISRLIREGPPEKLKQTENAQPAILTVSVATARVLAEKGMRPVAAAGHSLGEYSALVLAESISFEDAVRMVRLRGRFMQEAVPLGQGTMSAVLGAEDALVEEVCREVSAKGMLVEPANYNCPGQLVISGTTAGVAAAVEELKRRGAKKCIPLEVSAPFHCSLLKPAGDRLAQELKKITVRDPTIPYVANVDGAVVRKAEDVAPRLVSQVSKPVRWTQTLQEIFPKFSATVAVEVGPGQVVSGHVKKVDSNLVRLSTDTAETLQATLAAG